MHQANCSPVQGAPVGKIAKVLNLIKYAHSLMEVEGQSSEPVHRMICTIVGNYGGTHGFHHGSSCFAPLIPCAFTDTDDPTQMTFRNQHIHPVSFTRDCLMVHQLLMWDCPECEYVMDRCHGCLLIPRGVQFPPDLFPQIVLCHATTQHHTVTPKQAKMLHS